MKEPKVTSATRLEYGVKQMLEEVAACRGQTASATMREMIIQGLKNEAWNLQRAKEYLDLNGIDHKTPEELVAIMREHVPHALRPNFAKLLKQYDEAKLMQKLNEVDPEDFPK